MADVELKVGDVVYLKSGGPPMTVSKVYSQNQVSCTWASRDGYISDATFDTRTLELSPAEAELRALIKSYKAMYYTEYVPKEDGDV